MNFVDGNFPHGKGSLISPSWLVICKLHKLWKNVFVPCLGFSPSYVHILKVVGYDKNNITSFIFNFYCLEHKDCIGWYVWTNIPLLVTTCQRIFLTPSWCQILLHLLSTFHCMMSISNKTLRRMQQTLNP